MNNSIEMFVPGRLCLFGEHSDWAGLHRIMNADIVPGMAIVSGIEEGIYARAQKAEQFILETENSEAAPFSCEMDTEKLRAVAQNGQFYSYVAGVASYINEYYRVGGLRLTITKSTLPIKKGLSSSAAICVLVARAFNLIYDLKLSIASEMEIAFHGEQRTPSRCGRLDQACAYGIVPVLMTFDGDQVTTKRLRLKSNLHYVFADLHASKDTIRILSDLSSSYPFPNSDLDRQVHEALGKDNTAIIHRAVQYIEEGNQPALGKLMTEAQEIFDKKVAPKSPVELKGTVLHATMRDPALQQWIYGCKGVGSQGDGTVQFLAKDAQAQAELVAYLQNQKHLTAYALTLSPQKAVRKAIIPVAGLGLRLYPATKCIKKDFMTVLDQDGLLKPAILILLEQLYRANIREICLVIGEGERQMYEALFEPCPDEILQKLPQQKRDYDAMLQKIGRCITYLYQKERCGFGHAVYQCRDFAQNEPVLLLLGDMLYQTANPLNCMEQMMQVFDKTGKPVVSMHPIALQDVVHYGILHGKWENREETIMQLDAFVEKPACDYAQDYLNNTRQNCSGQFYAVFGQYILTPDVFDALAEDVSKGRKIRGEIQLTPALDRVRSKSGMIGYLIDGEAFDIGLPDKYRETVSKYGVHNGEGA